MNSDQSSTTFKKILLWFIIIFSGIIAVYLGFISLVSLWVGLENSREPGFWVPITAGAALLVVVFWIYARMTNIILKHMKNEDSLDF
jgi:hypothetical protein